jgi:hypothetical protein
MVKTSALDGMIKSLLLLMGQLVLVDDIELGSEVPILGHILNEDRQPLSGFIVQILLVINLREKENDLLKSLVVLTQDKEGVLLE